MDAIIMNKIKAIEKELSDIKEMIATKNLENRRKKGKAAIKDLLELSKHPKMKNWKTDSVSEIRASRFRFI